MGIVGLLVVIFGIATTAGAMTLDSEFSRDPVCTRSITLATEPRAGTTCSIVSGTISSTYRSETQSSTNHRSLDDHIVVFTSDGPVLDVVLENEFWSRMYDSATRGAPAVVETVDGRPAFIATSNGTLSAEADPQLPLEISWIFIPIGAMLLFVAIRKQPFTLREPRPGSTSRP
jgi:hypothetical protein